MEVSQPQRSVEGLPVIEALHIVENLVRSASSLKELWNSVERQIPFWPPYSGNWIKLLVDFVMGKEREDSWTIRKVWEEKNNREGVSGKLILDL